MKEEFLHFIWKHKLFSTPNLQTIDNEEIEIINSGILNTDSGPDFFNAKIKIGHTVWAGNVEIHVNSSDWFAHNHHKDKNYSNIILHAVYIHDTIKLEHPLNNAPIVLLPISDRLKQEYRSIYMGKNDLFCRDKIKGLKYSEIEDYLDYILVERFEEKYEQAKSILEKSNNSWNTLFFYLLLKSFGGYTNNAAFELIAQNLSFNILLRHSDSIFQLEAILFGLSGLLDEIPKDNYQDELQKEYEFLKAKYSLKSIEPHLWKFLRLRPSNFPTIRIAQLAALIYKTKGMFEKLVLNNQINDIFALLDLETSQYWQSHYHFGKQFKENWKTSIGKQTKYLIICNVIIPFIFTYYKENGDVEKIEKAMEWLQDLPSEQNAITRIWEENGIKSNNMAQSQALYHLKSRYCVTKRCINCRIGQKVLATTSNEE